MCHSISIRLDEDIQSTLADAAKARGIGLSTPEFAEAVKQQLALVEADADDRETLAFIETAADWTD